MSTFPCLSFSSLCFLLFLSRSVPLPQLNSAGLACVFSSSSQTFSGSNNDDNKIATQIPDRKHDISLAHSLLLNSYAGLLSSLSLASCREMLIA